MRVSVCLAASRRRARFIGSRETMNRYPASHLLNFSRLILVNLSNRDDYQDAERAIRV
jgi:hypothetical protein